jgi:ubiquinone/menaquinone biosynthesis C-methylase UbiE
MSEETLRNLKKREVCIDIGTGTGFLAKHFSGIFTRAIGTDLSDSQLRQAAESHKEAKNLEFKQLDVKNLPEFLRAEALDKGEVDLFSIGQALHWFEDIDGTLKTINSVLRNDSYFLVFAYTIPRINDGSDWKGKIAIDMESKGFEVIDGSSSTYSFSKNSDIHS